MADPLRFGDGEPILEAIPEAATELVEAAPEAAASVLEAVLDFFASLF